MGDFTIKFKMNSATGKRDITIEYADDDDMLPHEHEKRHREIVTNLLGKGILTPDESGNVKVQRVKPQRNGSEQDTGPKGEARATTG